MYIDEDFIIPSGFVMFAYFFTSFLSCAIFLCRKTSALGFDQTTNIETRIGIGSLWSFSEGKTFALFAVR
jgi:hypothetical protein